jgi:preprotein translocase subunit SecY
MGTQNSHKISQSIKTVNPGSVLFFIILSLIQTVNSLLVFILDDQIQRNVLTNSIILISVILIADFLVQLWRSTDRRSFFFDQRGWLLLLGSLPVPFIAISRLWWYFIFLRQFREADFRESEKKFVQRRAQSTLYVVVILCILIMEISSLFIVSVESNYPNANITSASDAMWWTLVTVSTVGYGDQYPVSPKGRIIGIFTILVGVALFSVLTGFISNWFSTKKSTRGNVQQQENSNEITTLISRVEELTEMLNKQQATHQVENAALMSRLDGIEAKITKIEPSVK